MTRRQERMSTIANSLFLWQMWSCCAKHENRYKIPAILHSKMTFEGVWSELLVHSISVLCPYWRHREYMETFTCIKWPLQNGRDIVQGHTLPWSLLCHPNHQQRLRRTHQKIGRGPRSIHFLRPRFAMEPWMTRWISSSECDKEWQMKIKERTGLWSSRGNFFSR